MSTVLDQQVSLSDLQGQLFCEEHPVPAGCQDSNIGFKIKVRADNRFTWWITCNFNPEKRDNDCEKTNRFSSVLCYDLICSSK